MGLRVDGKAMGKQGTYPLKAAVSGEVSGETETRNIGNGPNPKRIDDTRGPSVRVPKNLRRQKSQSEENTSDADGGERRR